MSWTSPFTVASTTMPLPPESAFSISGSRYATAAFIVSADCSTNGSCIWPLPNSSPTTFMPSSSTSFTICERRAASASCSSRSASRPSRSPSMMRCFSRSDDRPARAVFLLDRAGLDVLEQRHELGERVVVLAAAVVDEVERGFLLRFVDAVQRHDARRVHDRGVEPGLAALVQEHAVQHVARRGLEAERHVRQPEHGVRARQLGLDAADRLDRLHRVAAEVVVAGRQRERERVEDQVGRLEAVALDRDVVDALGDAHLPLGGAGLALFVDREADDGRAVLAREPEHAVHALALGLALFEVGRVEQRLAAVVLQARLRAPAVRSSRTRAAATPGWRSGPRSRPCRRCRRGRRSRRTRRGRARLPSPVRAPSARTSPSRPRASRRGTCASRSRSCARRSRGTRAPARTARASRSTSSPARTRACAPPARGGRAARRPRARCSGVVPQQPPTTFSPNSVDEAVVRLGEPAAA